MAVAGKLLKNFEREGVYTSTTFHFFYLCTKIYYLLVNKSIHASSHDTHVLIECIGPAKSIL